MPVHVIRATNESRKGLDILGAMEECAPDVDALMLWGIGRAGHSAHRDRAVHQGKRAILWDLGYTRGKYRVSLDHDHPWRLLDQTPSHARAVTPTLRDDAGNGPILLIGMGRKSKSYHNLYNWESRKIGELKRRFPGVPIVLRQKPRAGDGAPSIQDAIKGCRLVVCRHSNVAVDAVIAGVPFECEDGAAYWLRDKPFTQEVREDFMRRLTWWEYRTEEAKEAWAFLRTML